MDPLKEISQKINQIATSFGSCFGDELYSHPTSKKMMLNNIIWLTQGAYAQAIFFAIPIVFLIFFIGLFMGAGETPYEVRLYFLTFMAGMYSFVLSAIIGGLVGGIFGLILAIPLKSRDVGEPMAIFWVIGVLCGLLAWSMYTGISLLDIFETLASGEPR